MEDNYDVVIGYSPLGCVDPKKMRRTINNNRRIIDIYYSPRVDDIILVAGAGNGQEAILLKSGYNLKTVGVDISLDPSKLPTDEGLMFQKQDLMALAFSDNTFSIVYCNHVLEHVPSHVIVLKEIHRVLKSNGILFVSFPNRNRLVAYVGATAKVSVLEMIKWNLADYKYKLQGKFENKYGAHAGFTEKEFIEDASRMFQIIHPIRNQYMLLKYQKYEIFITCLIKAKLEEFVFPSNSYICVK